MGRGIEKQPLKPVHRCAAGQQTVEVGQLTERAFRAQFQAVEICRDRMNAAAHPPECLTHPRAAGLSLTAQTTHGRPHAAEAALPGVRKRTQILRPLAGFCGDIAE
ncbi:hypothetical protein ACE61L_000853 [Salmonella enterica]